MSIQDVLAKSGALSSIATELGLTEEQASTAANSLLPAILGGFQNQSDGHAGGLGGLLGQLGGGALLDGVLSPMPTDVSRGNEVLGQIFGSKDVSRTVANHASTRSGLAPALLKKMLPLLAMAVAGYMSKNHGRDGDTANASSGGILGDLLGGLLGGGGNPLDAILGKR